MSKVIAFIGSGRKNSTYKATQQFINNLKQKSEIESEIIMLADYNLEICKGCSLCLNKGEEHCPLKDDRDVLLGKINEADGIIFATPNYSFQISGLMKVFLDRFGFLFHRPRYFDKTFTNIVTQGIYGGKKITKYLNFIGNALGKNVNGSCIVTKEPISEKRVIKNNKVIEKHANRFFKKLSGPKLSSPSVFELLIFHISRNGIKKQLNNTFKDYNYYQEKGWFDSDFYYAVKLNPGQKLLGKIIDQIRI